MTDRVGRQQGTASDYIARSTRALRRHARVAPAGFDPNEDPVIIGANATAGGGSTPSSPSGGAAHAIAIGPLASAEKDYSLAIGYQATHYTGTGSGIHGVAIGYQASGRGNRGVAIGDLAFTETDDNVAIGSGASSTAFAAIAIGDVASASQDNAVALGHSADAGHLRAVALGAFSATTAADQVMLGAQDTHFVEAPRYNSTYGSIVVMKSPNGTRYALQVSNAGAFSVIASPV